MLKNISLKNLFLLFISTNLLTSIIFAKPTDLNKAEVDIEKKVEQSQKELQSQESLKPKIPATINQIIVKGNKHVTTDAILNRLPYKVGETFDESKSSIAIQNLYVLGYFRQIQLEREDLEDNKVDLYVTVEEKKLLEKIDFKGSKAIKAKKIKEDLRLDKLTTIDEEQLARIVTEIKKMYTKENYHKVQISTQIIPNPENPEKATALLDINEGHKSAVARVFFIGNKKMPARKLRNAIGTREDWLLRFLDNAGEYDPDSLEMDKHRIEYLYKDNGYIMAAVADTQVEFSKDNRKIFVTFNIKEGERFYVGKVEAAAEDDLFKEKDILHCISFTEGEPYCQSKLIDSINNLKDMWGAKGYIYADVYPQIKTDETSNKVDIIFHIEKGKKLYINRINITGNEVTRDNVIRRELDLEEGDLITTKKLNSSKNNVEYLSFFEKDGINWKIHRLSDELADLEMNVKEAKTGNLQAGLNYGSDQQSSRPSLKGFISVEKKNLLGRGWDVSLLTQASRHGLQKLQANVFDPNILDSGISGGADFYRQWEEYEQWHSINPKETRTGGDVRFGFQLPKIDKRLQLILDIGIEDIRYKDQPHTSDPIFEPVVKRTFQAGTLNWLGIDLLKDTRNHQIYPNKGYKLALETKMAIPALNVEFSFFKAELDASWYTPLIGEDTLVLMVHGKIGTIGTIGGTNHKTDKKKVIPYKELFIMGGQTTVRGFLWGSIGPAWINNDPLGGRHAFQFNTELLFPLIPDYSMKGHFFYDAGAGWDTPKDDIPNTSYLKRDKFHLRHAVGFGLNLLKPTPAKIDWGYKLDRDKKAGESPYEFHLSMNYAW